jgi:3-oxoacid CoA-transferase subunit A
LERDEAGNLILKEGQREFNGCMAGAAKITIAEVEEPMSAGVGSKPNSHTRNYGAAYFKGEKFERRIEQRTTQKKLNRL